MASLTPNGVCPDCGEAFSRACRGRPRRRCERCNRRHQNARARGIPPPGTAILRDFSTWMLLSHWKRLDSATMSVRSRC